MNLQELFNIVWERAKDKRKALSNKDRLYLAPNGLKCFIGAAIPPDVYKSIWDSADSSQETLEHEIMPALGLSENLYEQVCELQAIHDRWDVDTWHKELIKFAKDNFLIVPSESTS